MNNFDHSLFDTLLDQVETATIASGGLGNAAQWICKNTRDPSNPSRDYSLKGHEYQREILNSKAPQSVVRKATQIGLTELSLRLVLAACAKFTNINAIYVLPSIRFSQKVAMSRVDPIINASPKLKAVVSSSVNSNELKQIGSSFLHMTGAAQNSSAISIPARALFIDEYAFCDPQVVSVFASRLGHQSNEDKIVRYFSSPLHPHADISYLYEQGSQKVYLCYHDTCGQWVMVDPAEDMVIPGYSSPITELSYSDLDNKRYRIDEAHIACRHCHQPISTANLSDPDRRAWVPTFPDREIESFDANPLVLPQLRTCQRLLADLKLYKNTQRWLQFGLGRPAESAADMVLQSTLDRCFTVNPVPPQHAQSIYGAVLGMDVGKTSHLAFGKRTEQGFEVLWLETSTQTENNATGELLVQHYQDFHCVQGVIDAAPDVTLPKFAQGRLPYNQVWGCYFVRGRGKSNLASWEQDEVAGTVKVNRTRALDEFVEQFNKGRVRLPRGLPFEEEIRQHLQRLKRVLNLDTAGEEQAQWIATDPATHWFFAIFYAWLASSMAEQHSGVLPGMTFSRLLGRVRVAQEEPGWVTHQSDPQKRGSRNPLQPNRLSL